MGQNSSCDKLKICTKKNCYKTQIVKKNTNTNGEETQDMV